jgi:ADP-heptose:LPS heptosyltransferase
VRTDYEETAALVSALDLVISVCTAVIHLGGALGRPVWVMAPYSPEWRYGIAGEEMPWYPSVRVFRQAAFGEWDAVVERVAQSLTGFSPVHAPA